MTFSTARETLRFKANPPSRLPISRSNHDTMSPSVSLDSPVLFVFQQDKPSPTTGSFPLAPADNCQPSQAPLAVTHHQAVKQVQTLAQTKSQPSNPTSAMAVSLILPNEVAVPIEGLASTTLIEVDKNGWQKSMECCGLKDQDHQSADSSVYTKRTSGDAYNWRKYGQKHVKASENPRSYYKCTYPNCPTKKKVELSIDGHINEMIYGGEHNHLASQSAQRTIQPANSTLLGDGRDGESWGMKGDYMEKNGTSDSKLSSKLQPQGNYPSNSNSYQSSPSISDDEEGNKLVGGAVDGDEPNTKRRRKDEDTKEFGLSSETICEPLVQTRCSVAMLDDGYRWRKYGQKVTKGNPNPKSYHRCTNPGCPVRKYVERESSDPNFVIITCKGKHNHDVPIAKNGGNHSTQITGASYSAAQPRTTMLESIERSRSSLQAHGAKLSSIVANCRERDEAVDREITLLFQCGTPKSSRESL